jgi:drug/metabolite transporter (DMT)-like permease
MMGIALALAAACVWAFADFGSGFKSRTVPTLVVTAAVFTVGCLGTLALAAVREPLPDGRTVLLAVAIGAQSAIGVALFFHALSIGEIGVVAAIASGGTALPVLMGLARGERPSAAALIGVTAIICGAVAIVWAPRSATTTARDPRRAVLLAVGASLALGLYYVLARAGGGDTPIWFDALGQVFAAVPLIGIVLVQRERIPGPRDLRDVIVLGVANGAGWVLATLALQHGLLAVVSVLIALYPALTVLLAVVVIRERLTGLQYLSGGTILLGVGLVAVG